ncbi:hypothetical protein ACWDSF_20460, partial [Nocardia beijingensis]
DPMYDTGMIPVGSPEMPPMGGENLGARRIPRGAASGGLSRADQAMGDVAGDRWTNRSPDLGRSTIPR